MRIKQRPEDFVVRESWRFDPDPRGEHYVYLMDKQKLSTFQAVERICAEFNIRKRDVSFCGLKDKQGRTEQLVAVKGGPIQYQDAELRLKFLGRAAEPLSSANITSNRFAVTVRDLGPEDVERIPEAVREVERVGMVNYFDSQRFGYLKHQGRYIAKDLIMGDAETALKALMATPSKMDRTDDAKVKQFWAEHWGKWKDHCQYAGVVKYRHILRRLRERPRDFHYAVSSLEARTRAMIVYEYQSFLWNETVKGYLASKIAEKDLLSLRYQAGVLRFPRALPRGGLARTVPLLAPDSRFTDPAIEAAAREILIHERISLERLVVPKIPEMFFKHEERPLMVMAGKISASEGRPDEENRGRKAVNLAFTLPPGAYASLLVKRILWWGHPQDSPIRSGEGRKPDRPRAAAGRPSGRRRPAPKDRRWR